MGIPYQKTLLAKRNSPPPEFNQVDHSPLKEKLDSLKNAQKLAILSPLEGLSKLDHSVEFRAFTIEAPPQSAISEALTQLEESLKDSNQFIVLKSRRIKKKNAQQLVLDRIKASIQSKHNQSPIVPPNNDSCSIPMEDDSKDIHLR
ncbi:hypothetical protein SUGI_1096160 [Cryptomeria japonica]|nr:hypothetical protein SUGI_1096160 [Cryptomeria japonica]